ncbi:MAG: hypothetical protein ACPF83_05210 [Flavobacteriales bacterium]|jgi:hypothetical protein
MPKRPIHSSHTNTRFATTVLWGLLPVTAVTLFVLLVFEKPPRDFWPWVFLAGMALLPFGQVFVWRSARRKLWPYPKRQRDTALDGGLEQARALAVGIQVLSWLCLVALAFEAVFGGAILTFILHEINNGEYPPGRLEDVVGITLTGLHALLAVLGIFMHIRLLATRVVPPECSEG